MMARFLIVLFAIQTVGAWTTPTKSFRQKTIQLRVSSDLNNDNPTAEQAASLLALLRPATTCTPSQMSGTHLAYIGDCVYELFIRSKLVWPAKKTSDMQKQAVSLVNAEYQSMLLTKLKENFDLSPEEQNVLSRGRNATTRSANRRNPAAYQDSTALEALLGHLFITDETRLAELLRWLDDNIE